MEGGWRGVALALVAALAAVAGGGCGESSGDASQPEGAVATTTPVRTFAPLVEMQAAERYRPMSARWWIERSVFGYKRAHGCSDWEIAVGHTLPERHTPTTDWIYPHGLGKGPAYDRNPSDRQCKLRFGVTHYANDLTRPYDPGPRAEAAQPGAGYYLDLTDESRVGEEMPGGTPVYSERRDEGDGGVRITYWMLFGMHAPRDGSSPAHEGDWERVDVLLRDEGDGTFRPVAVQLGAGTEQRRDVPWEELTLVDRTHPAILLEQGSHTPAPSTGSGCYECVRWRAWDAATDVTRQQWYGFGGAWGEVGTSDATTGPLGPHGRWPTDAERERQLREEFREAVRES